MTRRSTKEESQVELFDNLEAICDDCPDLPGNRGRIGDEDAEYRDCQEYERFMSASFEVDVEWGVERLA